MKAVTVVDYGVGNLLSVCRALEEAGGQVHVAHTPEEVLKADRLVLPGVGAFASGMRELNARHLVPALIEFAARERPVLGICLGMQMLLDQSEEFGDSAGLGLIPGRVIAIPRNRNDGKKRKIPHIGWNEIQEPEGGAPWNDSILRNVPRGTAAYFVHSYSAVPEHSIHRLADCHYDGVTVSAAIQKNNLYGTQFHPERSGPGGIQIITTFLNL